MTAKEKIYYKRIHSTFIGRKIVEVFYQELDDQTDAEYWEHSTDIHSIDMNVIFRLDNEELFQIKWDNEFYCYGIGFEQLTELTLNKQLKLINLTENSNWKPLLGKSITEVLVLWDESYHQEIESVNNEFITQGNKTPIKLPQTWQMEFGNEKIWISALEIKEVGEDYYWADHLTVLFTEQGQEQYKLLKNTSRQHAVSLS